MTARRVLLVDDDPGIRRAYAMLLQGEGCDVDQRATIADALAALDDGDFDVVVSDLNLTDGCGMEVLERALHRDVRCVLVTGEVGYRAAQDPQLLRVLRKPFRAQLLVQAVDVRA